MSVASTQNRFPYVGDGATLAFAFPNFFIVPNDIIVFVFDTLTKTVTDKVLGTNYTVTGTLDDNGVYSSGGTINFLAGQAPLATDYVVLVRALSETQSYKPGQNATANPSLNELAWDKLTLMIQRMQELYDRSVVLHDGFAGTFNPNIPADFPGNPGTVLMQDPTGEFFITGPDLSSLVPSGGGGSSSVSVTAVDTSGGNVANVLPAIATVPGQIIALFNKSFGSGNHIAVSTTGGATIMGGAADNVEAGECKWYWNDSGTQWFIIAAN